MRKWLGFVCLTVLLAAGGGVRAHAQNDAMDLYSPAFLAGGADAATLDSPEADRLNPAASGSIERPTFELSYIGLAGLGRTAGWGNVVNAGITIPTAAGVFTGSGRFLDSSFPALDLGDAGDFNVAFSKDIYPNFSVGAGIDYQIGSASRWGLGLSLGVMDRVGDVAFLKDVRWGVSMLNMGYGFQAAGGSAGVGTSPPVFTPDLSASFDVLQTPNLTISLAPDLSFPSFQDVRFTLGGHVAIDDLVTVHASGLADLTDIDGSTARPVPAAGGVSVKLTTNPKQDVQFLGITKNGWNRSDITVTGAAAPLQDGVWAMGAGAQLALGQIDRTPPVVQFNILDPDISPNGDGIQDSLVVSFTVQDQRYIKGYRFVITDDSGNPVRTIGAEDNGPTSTGVRNFFDRLFAVKKSIQIPQSMTWDGKNDNGVVVPDGTYHYYVEAWDDNGNIGKSPVGTVVVDTVAPSAKVTAPYLEFSPNGDGKKDVLIVDQTGSVENTWVGTISNAGGTAVARYEWDNSAPTGFQWTGQDQNGAKLPDGVYSYRLTATDAAGNTGSASLAGIVLNTQSTPVNLTTNVSAFSPNGDGVKDSLQFNLDVPVQSGIQSWTLTVKGDDGNALRTFSGGATTPGTVSFDGRDDAGKTLPDGTYTGTLSIVYVNGNNPVSVSPAFVVDDTAPNAQVSAPYTEFSPNGDGRKDTLPISQTGSTETLWTGVIRSATGNDVLHQSWTQSTPQDFQWNGRDDSGRLVPDGTYVYELTSTDAAGNIGLAKLTNIVVNTTPTPVTLAIDQAAFSPNGDGVKDSIHFSIDAPVTNGLQSWKLDVTNSGGDVVRSFQGSTKVAPTVEFDGKDANGKTLPEGPYRGSISLQYANGNNPTAVSPAFVLDLTPPNIAVTADYSVFSPNGDGNKDFITFTQTSPDQADWTGTVRNTAGTVVKTVTWRNTPDQKFVWDGHGDDKTLLPDGRYTYVLEGTDAAGNTGRSAEIAFSIDTTETPVVVSTDQSAFSPNGDGKQDTVGIIPSIKITSGIVSYQLQILDASNRAVRTFSGSNTVPAKITWDGRDDIGNKAPDGKYLAQLSVRYQNGNNPVAKSNTFTIDTVAPSADVSASTLLFSPDGDGRLDTDAFTQRTSTETSWDGSFADASGTKVRTYFWKGTAPSFIWDGKDDTGNVVPDGTYTYTLSSTDDAGNTTTRQISGIVVDTRPTPIAIGPASDGFSPNGDGFRDTLGFNLSVGLRDGVSSWSVAMTDQNGVAQKTFRGNGAVPDTLSWDGKTDAGGIAADGRYTAQMTVEYTKGNRPQAQSAPFLLAASPPKVDVTLGPLPFSPDGDGVNDTLTLGLKATDPSPITNWDIAIVDPVGHAFKAFSGTGAPPAALTWDGLSSDGELVQSAEDYPMTVTMKDALGNVARVQKTIPIDILVIREGDKLKIRISSITFQADTANYTDVPPDRLDRNLKTIARLAEIFKKYSQYDIRIEGYAVMVYWNDPTKGQVEQQQTLIPLSQARADAIKSALVKLGLDPARITTVGLGGTNPIVPFSDLDNRWKDRRVEFILIRKGGT